MRFLLAVAALLAALARSHEIEKRQAVDVANRVVCYYTNWSVYRKGLAKYTPQNINPYLCTHLVYAFGGLTDEFEIKPFDSYQDIEQGGYAKFNGLKQYNKGLKTLLAIGGWNEGSGRFSELVSLPEFRKSFIISAIKHLRRYNFDGLDLDWEYPASRDGSTPEDRENYATLVRELREAFEDEGTKVKNGRLLLTMAVPAGQNYIDKGYDIPSLTSDLDFFNILNYDYHSAYEPSVNHHAALMPSPGTSEYAWNAQLNVDWTVKYYISLGADKHKLVIGVPTYGRSYTLIDGNFTDFGSSADGPGEQGKYTRENGFMAFYEVCENIASNGWDVSKPFPRRIGPYAYSGDQWVGYDDEKIVARKAEYVRENGLGGIMYWSLDNDDFRGICNGEQYPLVEAGKKALFTDVDLDVSLNEARALQRPAGGRRTTVSVATQDVVDDTRRGGGGSTGNRFKTRNRSRTRSQSTSRTRGQESTTRTRTQDTFQTSSQDSTRTRNQGSVRSRNQNSFSTRTEEDAGLRTQDTFRTRTPERSQSTFRTRTPNRAEDTFNTRSQERSQSTFRTRTPNRAEDTFNTRSQERYQSTFRTRTPNRAEDSFNTRSQERSQDDRYQDDRFQDDRFQEDRFQDDRFQDDRFQDDRFQDDRFQDDRFQDNTRPQSQDTFDTRFQDDRFQDDRFQEDRFQDDTRTETRGTFRTRSQDRAQDPRRPDPIRTASQSDGTRTRGGTSFATTQLSARRPPRIKPSTRTPASLSTRLQNRRRPTSRVASSTSRPTRPAKPSRTSARTPRPGRGNRRRQGGRRKQTTTIDPLNTPAPPTTPSPVSGFTCKREGFYPNPENCHKYYWCLDSGASGLGVVAHAFACPSDLVFSKTIDGCDHPTRTKCSTDKKGRGGAAATTPSSSGSSGTIPTTTEIPVDYSYLDDYYYDDEYYYDYEDPAVADLPTAVEEVPNTVSRQLQNSGGSQFTGGSTSSRDSSFNQDTSSTSSSGGALGGRTRPQYSNIARDRSQTQQAAADSSSSRRQEAASNARRRPQYTTIPRERTAAQGRPAEEEVGLAREADPTAGGREYVVLNRNRPSTSGGGTATPAPFEEQYPTQPTLEYVTIDRSRGRTTPDIPTLPPPSVSDSTVSPAPGLVEVARTTPRYVTIQRGRSTTEEDLTTTLEDTTVAGVPAPDTGAPPGDDQPSPDYYYYDEETLNSNTGSPDLVLPGSSPPPPPPPPPPQTTTVTSSTTTTPTTTTPSTTTPTTTTTTEPTTITSTTRTRPRVRGRPVGSLASRLESSAGGGSRRTSETRFRLPSKPLPSASEGEEAKGKQEEEEEVKEEVLRPAPGAPRRPSPRQPTGTVHNNRRRVLVRKRFGVNVASGQDEATPGTVRIRTRRPPASSRTPTRLRPTRPQPEDASLQPESRPRPTRPQSEDASPQPESRQRPTRPLIQIGPRPNRPSAESPRLTRPSAEGPRPTLEVVDAPRPRPLRPQLSTAAPAFSSTASPPDVAEEEEEAAVTALDEVFFQETTIVPESTARPSFASLFPRPQATTPSPITHRPRPSTTPRPRPSTTPRLRLFTTTRPPPTTAAAPRSRGSPRPRTTPQPTQRPQLRVTTPRPPARSPRPPRPVFAKIPLAPQHAARPAQSSILSAGDYTDYYYDDLDGALTGTLGQLATLTEKAILMADGSVQCYDTGYFAHPDSCKKFISCSKTVRGVVRGWVYTCPQQLVFDPVGGMCNWAETVDCEGRK